MRAPAALNCVFVTPLKVYETRNIAVRASVAVQDFLLPIIGLRKYSAGDMQWSEL